MDPRPLRIAQVAPPLERVPPRRYGGTERVVHELSLELLRRGHDVTLFASGDSELPGRHVATVPRALRPIGFGGDSLPYFVQTELAVLRRANEFDVIHSHLEWASLSLAAASPVPVVSTFHGRLDGDYARELMRGAEGLVAISANQAATHPEVAWEGVVHHGLTLRDAPFERRRGDDLCFVGRIEPEKGVLDAIEVARLSGRKLRIAAKVGTTPDQRAYYEEVFRPALERADVEFLGEVDADRRDRMLAECYACLVPGTWPEPFGLATIEALACGTPVIARRVGALPEVVRDGVDGFFGDDPAQMAYWLDRVRDLDRLAIRRSAIERFSPARMTDGYERIYERVIRRARRIRPVEGVEIGRRPIGPAAVAGPAGAPIGLGPGTARPAGAGGRSRPLDRTVALGSAPGVVSAAAVLPLDPDDAAASDEPRAADDRSGKLAGTAPRVTDSAAAGGGPAVGIEPPIARLRRPAGGPSAWPEDDESPG